MEREGDSINRATVRSCIYMLEGLYENNSELEADRLYLTSFEGSSGLLRIKWVQANRRTQVTF